MKVKKSIVSNLIRTLDTLKEKNGLYNTDASVIRAYLTGYCHAIVTSGLLPYTDLENRAIMCRLINDTNTPAAWNPFVADYCRLPKGETIEIEE